MISEEKIKQVIAAIKENGIKTFRDEELSRLLSILTEEELNLFEEKAYVELGGVSAVIRIHNLRPYVSYLVNQELNKIYNSEVCKLFIEALKRNQYYAYIRKLNVEELASLKKYLSFTYKKNDPLASSATDKLLKLITKEIIVREQNKDLVFI